MNRPSPLTSPALGVRRRCPRAWIRRPAKRPPREAAAQSGAPHGACGRRGTGSARAGSGGRGGGAGRSARRAPGGAPISPARHAPRIPAAARSCGEASPSLRAASGALSDSRGYRTRVVDDPLHYVSRGHPGPLRVALRATFNITRRALCLTGAVVRSALRAVYQGLDTPLAHAPAASPAVRVAFARVLAPAPCGPRARLRRGRTSRQASRRPSAAAAEGAGTASAYWRACSCGARSFVAVLLAPRDAASSCQRGREPPRRAAKKRSLAALLAVRLLHRGAHRQTTSATEASWAYAFCHFLGDVAFLVESCSSPRRCRCISS